MTNFQDCALPLNGGVLRVIQAMKGRLDEPFSLKSMAKVAYSSPYHFNRTFRRVTGIPPSQFLWALRLEAATRRLAATKDSVLNVCYDVGYNSLGTFTRRFTELFGVPPARFRTLAQAGENHQPGLQTTARQQPEQDAQIPPLGEVEGWLEYPEGFSGPTAIALFAESIPRGRPAACCFMTSQGAYRITGVPDGQHYLFALGLSEGLPLWETQTMLRAGGSKITIEKGTALGATQLTLRPPLSTDPPILLALPVWLKKTNASKQPNTELYEDVPMRAMAQVAGAHGD